MKWKSSCPSRNVFRLNHSGFNVVVAPIASIEPRTDVENGPPVRSSASRIRGRHIPGVCITLNSRKKAFASRRGLSPFGAFERVPVFRLFRGPLSAASRPISSTKRFFVTFRLQELMNFSTFCKIVEDSPKFSEHYILICQSFEIQLESDDDI